MYAGNFALLPHWCRAVGLAQGGAAALLALATASCGIRQPAGPSGAHSQPLHEPCSQVRLRSCTTALPVRACRCAPCTRFRRARPLKRCSAFLAGSAVDCTAGLHIRATQLCQGVHRSRYSSQPACDMAGGGEVRPATRRAPQDDGRRSSTERGGARAAAEHARRRAAAVPEPARLSVLAAAGRLRGRVLGAGQRGRAHGAAASLGRVLARAQGGPQGARARLRAAAVGPELLQLVRDLLLALVFPAGGAAGATAEPVGRPCCRRCRACHTAQKQQPAEEAHMYALSMPEIFCMIVLAVVSRPQCAPFTLGLHSCTAPVNLHLRTHHSHGLSLHMLQPFMLQLHGFASSSCLGMHIFS